MKLCMVQQDSGIVKGHELDVTSSALPNALPALRTSEGTNELMIEGANKRMNE